MTRRALITTLSPNLKIFALMLVSCTMIFAQMPAPRANGKIAFSYDLAEDVEIYTINNDGSDLTRLTNDVDLGKYNPSWSPDGRKLAFLSRIGSTNYELKLMNADGSNQTTLTTTNERYPSRGVEQNLSWSPDGRKIAFASNWDIFTINIDGSDLVNLTNNPTEEGEPDWSPDGSKIAFTKIVVSPFDPGHYMSAIHVMDPDGRNVQPTDNYGYNYANKANWSPSGERLAYLWDDYQGPEVGLLAIYGRGIISGEFVWSFDWSPDGSKFVVATYLITPGLYVMNSDGGSRTLILPGAAIQPDWQALTFPNASLSGRVLTPDGRGLRNATVTLTEASGVARSVTTSSFGQYSLTGVPAGVAVTLSVSSKRYRFGATILAPTGDLTGIDLVGKE